MSRPSQICFRIAQEELGVGLLWTVTPVVDGVSLVELARRQEVRAAQSTKEPDLAGRYAGLVIGRDPFASGWQGSYLGQGMSWFNDGDTCLLGCVCGDTGCWPLTAHIEIGVATVTWRRFRTGHRDWDLGGLGPFVFTSSDYQRALAEPQRTDEV